jgi:hypothetical protein
MTFQNIQPGQKVWFSTPQGIALCGRAQRLLCFPTHVVVAVGGRGQPRVVNAQNYLGTGSRHPSTK